MISEVIPKSRMQKIFLSRRVFHCSGYLWRVVPTAIVILGICGCGDFFAEKPTATESENIPT